MPKIKVKNIPSAVVEKICNCHIHCKGCVLYHKSTVNGIDVWCRRDPRNKQDETIVELSNKEFPTNREWLASLSNDKLANNLVTNPIFVESSTTIEKWLSQPCESLMEIEDWRNNNDRL